MKIALVNPYELGRQPFGLAEPATLLARVGCEVVCCDLSIQKLDACLTPDMQLVAIYVPMHTATRIAVEALPKIRQLAPQAHLCIYGLYAPMNVELFRSHGVDSIIGGEFENALLELVGQLRSNSDAQPGGMIRLDRTPFVVPDRSGLPALSSYAHLIMPDGTTRTVGFAETTRGCKYLCRHCPVVPVYQGKFFVVPADVVLADIDNQVAAGASHISFGDPDFFNGPGHALRIVRKLHERHPQLTWDATIKIEHIVRYPEEIRELARCGCLFIVSAVESVDDRVLALLDKGHTRADFVEALDLMRSAGIALAPTFVAFTPWTTLDGYIALLRDIMDLQLVEAVAPVQLSIRLLVPAGSHVLAIPDSGDLFGPFDAEILGHPWRHPDPRMDALQQDVQARVQEAEAEGQSRAAIFTAIWRMAHAAAGEPAPAVDLQSGRQAVPRLSENWYCCAEPTCEQLASF
ncbi:MAG: CUAEP/CCAEP-tail radical SAM protein [Thiohalobacterales bacterium]|nr:CUAEP/CCAEP-tail radical SAM protein [Thiohalobacterales bacterium]